MQDNPTFHSLQALGALIRQISGLPDAERFDALSSACRALGGMVIQPGRASHMHELSVLGVYAGAAEMHELVLSWLRSARRLRRALAAAADAADHQHPPVAIDFHPDRHSRQLVEAMDMIARPDRHDGCGLISACRIILAHGCEHSERELACQSAAVSGHSIPGMRSA